MIYEDEDEEDSDQDQDQEQKRPSLLRPDHAFADRPYTVSCILYPDPVLSDPILSSPTLLSIVQPGT